MLQFYSTPNITKQMPDRFPPTQCKTKDKKKTLGLQTVGIGYGLIALLQGAKEKFANSKSGHFNVPKTLLWYWANLFEGGTVPGKNGPNWNFVPRNKPSGSWIYNSTFYLLARFRRSSAVPPLNHKFSHLVLKNGDKCSPTAIEQCFSTFVRPRPGKFFFIRRGPRPNKFTRN